MVKISASILSADFANLQQDLQKLESSNIDMLHIDVMDGNFVPNISIGAPVIKSLRKHSKLVFDVHLMIQRPELAIIDYIQAGADIITIHPETTIHLDRTLDLITKYGVKAGVSLMPASSPSLLDYVMDKIDVILIMTVNPGFAGQTFIASQLEKVRIVAEKVKNYKKKILIAVDGGINQLTAQECIKAGSDILVCGSFIFNSHDYRAQILKLKNQ